MHHIVKKETELEQQLISEIQSFELSQTHGTSVALDVKKRSWKQLGKKDCEGENPLNTSAL